jgi:hypothetical protein
MVVLYPTSVLYTLEMNSVVSLMLRASIPLFLTIWQLMSGLHHTQCDAENSKQQAMLAAHFGLYMQPPFKFQSATHHTRHLIWVPKG